MHHHRKWKRRRPHTLPVLHRTLHRYSWERDMRHEAAGGALSSSRHSGGLFFAALMMLLLLAVFGNLLVAAYRLLAH